MIVAILVCSGFRHGRSQETWPRLSQSQYVVFWHKWGFFTKAKEETPGDRTSLFPWGWINWPVRSHTFFSQSKPFFSRWKWYHITKWIWSLSTESFGWHSLNICHVLSVWPDTGGHKNKAVWGLYFVTQKSRHYLLKDFCVTSGSEMSSERHCLD